MRFDMDNPNSNTDTNSSTSGPTKETIEIMTQTFLEVAPNITTEQQV